MAFGFGGSASKSKSSQSVWSGQAPYLQGLYQRAYQASLGGGTGGQMIGQRQNIRGDGIAPGGQYGRMQPGGPGGLMGGMGGPLGGGYQGGDPLQGLGADLTQQGQGFLGNLGMMGQAGNPYAQAQIGQLGQGLGRLFNQQIMPGIQSTFGQAGQLGGSRQALAQGQAAEGLGQAFTGGALDILGNSSQLALQANQAGLGGLGQVFGAGQSGMFGSLPGLAGLLGDPTVLGKSSSKSGSANFGAGL